MGISKINFIDIGLNYKIKSEKVYILSNIYFIIRKNIIKDKWKVWLVLAINKIDWFKITFCILVYFTNGFKLDIVLCTTFCRSSKELVFTCKDSCIDLSYKGFIKSF